MTLAEFNSAALPRAEALLSACLDVPRWVRAVLAGRPYADHARLREAAEAATPLRAEEISAAIAAHPRIGEKAAPEQAAAGWSRSEQSGVDDSAAELFKQANAEYEQRFGQVYLVCASGRSGEELLADLRARLGNDQDTELLVAGRELAKIALLRLEKAVR
ncbi:2-oxo-4-hydroxy-4-carboxy-5-ureidoimidazoline decarboxylase [Amycolatopsis nigrescens]|uniref:2-oxo-4-hydroxy-4-carboxy-5-ureidoimidazoline decarboxylase n=1 Tax=Amycolatopsis nigrescens TaxID=381445 RepID=UPI000373A8E3|nr:2-oxo-4-hydroxy-4-carboxy-5-ureidoimidazoline decarboxylase [Amycolatopsis nigrescens]